MGFTNAQVPTRAPKPTRQERIRFFLVLGVALLMAGSLFLVIRAMQERNSQQRYEECLVQAQRSFGGTDTDLVPEDVCREPR